MAGDSGQKNEHHMLQTIVGQLTAFSLVLRTNPQVAFMEFMCGKQEMCRVALRQHLATYKNLTMGKLYEVTHLRPKKMLYSDGEAVLLLETTHESSFILSMDAEEMVLQPSLNISSYEGKVVESCSSLGIYRLHDNNRLCLAFLMRYADVPLPSVGQTVSVYNCHLWKNDCSDRYDLVLCGRSSIILHGKSDKTPSSGTCILMHINLKCTYIDLLWLEKQLEQFEEKFSSPFLIANGILSKSVSELQQIMLIKAVNIHYPVKDVKERCISKEFLFSPHQCIVSKPHTFVGMYLTLHDLCKQSTSKYNPLSSKSWNYHVIHYTDGLVGLLSTSFSYGYWTLSDATKSIPCVLTGDVESLIILHGAVVLLMKCTIVTEVFEDVNFVYIYFAATDARVIHTFDSRAKNDNRLRKKNNSVMTCHSEGCVSGNDKVSTSDIFHARGNFDVENIVGYHLVNKETVVPSKYTWLIVVHHKTTAAKTPQCALPVCCILISLIRRIHEVAEGYNSTQRQYLMLTGKLLQFVPFLSKNFFYMLSLPDDPACRPFPRPCRLKLISRALPDVWGVCLPEESTFLSIDTQKPGFIDLKADSYNVSEKILQEVVGQKELVNVEGVICDRLHTDVKYDSEKVSHVSGYGIPGMKNIVLKLEGTPGSGKEISLYLSSWNYRAYPFGLIPGARICAMFVAKHKSRNSSYIYLQATELTTIEVLYVPQIMGIEILETCSSTSDDWGESCILTQQAQHTSAGSILWGSLNMLKILKLTVATSCSHCSSIFRSGCCVGCSTYPPSSKLSVSATCCMEDIFGKILIFIKDEQVHQFLGLSKQYWDILTKLISRDGHQIELPQNQWNPCDPIGKRVLQALLKAVNKQQPRFHILCRKMKMNKTDARYEELPKLYCLALRRPRPALFYPMHKTRMS